MKLTKMLDLLARPTGFNLWPSV